MSVVTIFSGSFCGAEEAAHLVARELGCKLMRDEDIIGLAAGDEKLKAGTLRRAMYGRPSIFNQFTHERERAVSRLKTGHGRPFGGRGKNSAHGARLPICRLPASATC